MDANETTRKDLSSLQIPEGARSFQKGPKRKLWLGLGIAAGLLVTFFLLRSAAKPTEVVLAEAAQPAGGEGSAVLNASGYVTPRRRATVAAKITGRVVEMLVDEGMEVEAGQVLARLDDSDARARLVSAEADAKVADAQVPDARAALSMADLEFQRVSSLHRAGFASDNERDRARTAYDSARARLDSAQEALKAARARESVARQDLDNCTVRAPFGGIAVSKDAQVGEMVSPVSAGGGFTRTGIATIVDMASLEIEVDVNESFIAKVRPGQRVEAVLDAYPDWKIPAFVRTVIPTADRQKATVKVRISFGALDPRILPDMGVKVTFLADAPPVGAPRAAATVPSEAVWEEDGRRYVFVLKEGRLSRRDVTLGERRGMDVDVLSGCAPGDRLVIKDLAGLKDGMRAIEKR
ncbi:MAG: efflux RND transporter periplasmic adaptor subunit [Acidobacteriota bacterium]